MITSIVYYGIAAIVLIFVAGIVIRFYKQNINGG